MESPNCAPITAVLMPLKAKTTTFRTCSNSWKAPTIGHKIIFTALTTSATVPISPATPSTTPASGLKTENSSQAIPKRSPKIVPTDSTIGPKVSKTAPKTSPTPLKIPVNVSTTGVNFMSISPKIPPITAPIGPPSAAPRIVPITGPEALARDSQMSFPLNKPVITSKMPKIAVSAPPNLPRVLTPFPSADPNPLRPLTMLPPLNTPRTSFHCPILSIWDPALVS